MTELTSANSDEDEPIRPALFGGFVGLEAAMLALLLVVMIGQTVYLLSYSATIRRTQDALICQAQTTNQLRQAARIERDAQRVLLTAVINPVGATPEERRAGSHEAMSNYLNALVKADADRASVAECPTAEPS